MKRFHVHIAVESIEQSTQFYSTLFGQSPTVAKTDYAKWMLDDPYINFAISQRPAHAGQTGLDHMGFQMDSAPELHAMTTQLQAAGLAVVDEGETTCCYAKSDKGWVHDPQGIAWESFVTMGEATTYGVESAASTESAAGACCAPSAPKPKVSLADIAVRPAASCGTAPESGAQAACC
ncbi:MAG: glyoxalase/bleomycin resistance/dioxygenase family protein [Burkholderiales bacterium]|nr:MAG: glyoxalase/bleomycin resistance/dioxygenase family protein [Burkholderiales bacterium]